MQITKVGKLSPNETAYVVQCGGRAYDVIKYPFGVLALEHGDDVDPLTPAPDEVQDKIALAFAKKQHLVAVHNTY